MPEKEKNEMVVVVESVLNGGKEPLPKVVARLSRGYSSHNGTHTQYTHIRCLRRQCEGFNFFEDDIEIVGLEAVMNSIVNLEECDSGIYEIIFSDVYRDSTGEVDGYSYKLVPLEDDESPI